MKGPKYKKFSTRAEAEEFVRTGGKSSGAVSAQPAKKARTSQGSSTDRCIHVYTDGSSRGNGKKGALAGVGVYFGDNDPR